MKSTSTWGRILNVSSATQSLGLRLPRKAADQFLALTVKIWYPNLLNSTRSTIVMGDSVGAKFVMVWTAPRLH